MDEQTGKYSTRKAPIYSLAILHLTFIQPDFIDFKKVCQLSSKVRGKSRRGVARIMRREFFGSLGQLNPIKRLNEEQKLIVRGLCKEDERMTYEQYLAGLDRLDSSPLKTAPIPRLNPSITEGGNDEEESSAHYRRLLRRGNRGQDERPEELEDGRAENDADVGEEDEDEDEEED